MMQLSQLILARTNGSDDSAIDEQVGAVMKRARRSRHVVAAARCACRWFSRLAIIYFTEGIYGIARAYHVKVYDVLRVRLVG